MALMTKGTRVWPVCRDVAVFNSIRLSAMKCGALSMCGRCDFRRRDIEFYGINDRDPRLRSQ